MEGDISNIIPFVMDLTQYRCVQNTTTGVRLNELYNKTARGLVKVYYLEKMYHSLTSAINVYDSQHFIIYNQCFGAHFHLQQG